MRNLAYVETLRGDAAAYICLIGGGGVNRGRPEGSDVVL